MVQDNTVVLPGSDAAVLRIKDAGRWIAISTDCNGAMCFLDPFEGAKAAVAESARNVVCSGARPLGITNCLNFGNPMKPEIFWQFRQAILGMIEALKVLELPVTGGNVSLYNENPRGAVDPTPVIGTVGLIEQESHITTQWFKHAGDKIVLLGSRWDDAIDASQYLKRVHGLKRGKVPVLDLRSEKALQSAVLSAIGAGCVSSAHDLSEGGLAVALAESSFGAQGAAGFGARVELQKEWIEGKRLDGILFGEAPSRVALSVPPEKLAEVETICRGLEVPLHVIGSVEKAGFTISSSGHVLVDAKVEDLKDLWSNALEKALGF
jgi:phosphoribosylformylglycinamidine synthase